MSRPIPPSIFVRFGDQIVRRDFIRRVYLLDSSQKGLVTVGDFVGRHCVVETEDGSSVCLPAADFERIAYILCSDTQTKNPPTSAPSVSPREA